MLLCLVGQVFDQFELQFFYAGSPWGSGMWAPIVLECRCSSKESTGILAAFALMGTSFTVLTFLYLNPLDWAKKGDRVMWCVVRYGV